MEQVIQAVLVMDCFQSWHTMLDLKLMAYPRWYHITYINNMRRNIVSFMNKWYDNLVNGYVIFGLYWLGGCGGALLLVLSICTGIVSLPLWVACLPFALPVGILFVSLSGLPYFKMISWSKEVNHH